MSPTDVPVAPMPTTAASTMRAAISPSMKRDVGQCCCCEK
jgi:hypothetical protein